VPPHLSFFSKLQSQTKFKRFTCTLVTSSTRQIIMDSITNRPILIYDDKCSSCIIFAKYAFKSSRGQIDCIGHYSNDGEKFRKLVFPPSCNETEMFWIITHNHAYGGRSALLPLLVLIIKGLVTTSIKHKLSMSRTFPGYCSGSAMCNSNKFKFRRLYKLLSNGKKLNVGFVKSVKG
jgi:hypothetical protein